MLFFYHMFYQSFRKQEEGESNIQGNNSGKFSRLLKDTEFQIQEAK